MMPMNTDRQRRSEILKGVTNLGLCYAVSAIMPEYAEFKGF